MIKDSGSNYSFGVDTPVATVPKASFNMSYVTSTTMNEGEIIPTWYEYTVPGDNVRYSNQTLIRVLNTPTVPLASRQRLFHHTYYSSLSRLWKDFDKFMSKGYSKNDFDSLKSMVTPKIKLSSSCFARGGLLDNLGFNGVIDSSISTIEVIAFKPMLYLRCIRDNYINKRIFATWLDYMISHPDDSGLDYQAIKNFMFNPDDSEFRIGTPSYDVLMDDTTNNHQITRDWLFGSVWYRDWTQDYFTSALTTPTIIDEPNLDENFIVTFQAKTLETQLTLSNTKGIGFGTNGTDNYLTDVNYNTSLYSDSLQPYGFKVENGKIYSRDKNTYTGSNSWTDKGSFPTYKSANNTSSQDIVDAFNNTMCGVASGNLTMEALRSLACASAILEKMAKMDGTFGSWAKGFFGIEPSDSCRYNATYVGGAYSPIQFTDVVNVANNQGDTSGRGFCASQNGIGNFFADNYGIAMTLSMVMPDTYYTQGLHRQDLYQTSEDFYIPEKSKLGMDAIFNAELYNTFGKVTGNGGDDDIFGYQNRFDYMRYRYNECHGLVADETSLVYSPYIEKRIFNSCPSLNPQFLSTKDTIAGLWRSSQSDEDPAYFVQILNSCYMNRPLPYKAIENNMGF